MIRNVYSCLIIVEVLLAVLVSSSSYPQYNICNNKNIELRRNGEESYVGVTRNNTQSKESAPCITRIQTCPYCYLLLELADGDWYLGDEKGLDKAATISCVQGREYFFVFDGYYMDRSLSFYASSSVQSFHQPFNTTSRILYIGYCGRPRDIIFKISSHSKTVNINGDTSSSGSFESPYFPVSYVQNGEHYTYNFSSKSNKSIYILFDDWDLATSSEVYFGEGNQRYSLSTASDKRPVYQSRGPQLIIIFNTGDFPIDGGSRKHLGFKFKYKFKTEIDIPRTDCGAYIRESVGGFFEFQEHSILSGTRFDCVWVIKKKTGFQFVYLKFVTFTGNYGSFIRIHDGLTSKGKELTTIWNNLTGVRDFISDEGFYIRISGWFNREDYTKFVYSSFSDDCTGYGLYVCDNKRCISNTLKCDDADHCGDNSDENRPNCFNGLGGNGYTTSSQYHVTISVIIPMVISIFLLLVLCILFILIRRCRLARQREMADARQIASVSSQVHVRGRRRGRHREFVRPADYPPTYEEALVTGTPCPDDPYMSFWQSSNGEMPKPPTYEEATSPQPHIMPQTASSCDTTPSNSYLDNTISPSSHNSSSSSNSRPVNHSHSMSYSSESSSETSPNERRFHQRDLNVSEPPINQRNQSSHRSDDENGSSNPSGSSISRNKEISRYDENVDIDYETNRKKSANVSKGVAPESGSEIKRSRNTSAGQDGDNKKRLHHLMQRLQPSRNNDVRAQRKLLLPDNPKRGNDHRLSESKETKPGDREDSIQPNDLSQKSRNSSLRRSSELLFDERHFEQPERGHHNQGYRHSDEFSIPSQHRNLTHSNGAMAASLGDLHDPCNQARVTSPDREKARSLQHLPITSQSPSHSSSSQSQRQFRSEERPLSMSVDNLDRSPRRRLFHQIQENQRSRSCADRDQMVSANGYGGRRSSAECMMGGEDIGQPGFLNILSDKIDEDVYV